MSEPCAICKRFNCGPGDHWTHEDWRDLDAELAELERTNPKVREAAERLDATMADSRSRIPPEEEQSHE